MQPSVIYSHLFIHPTLVVIMTGSLPAAVFTVGEKYSTVFHLLKQKKLP